MPPRLIDFDALWSSDKLFACAVWARREYSWVYGLADAHGSFELTNIRVIHGRVAPIRDDLSLEQLSQIFDEFHEHGLLFTWDHGSKRYGHWTNCEGRLPPKSLRDRYARLAPPVPEKELAEYLAKFSRHPLDPDKTASRRPLEFAMTGEGEGEGEGKEKPKAPAPKTGARELESPEFQAFWDAYPRHEGRKAALKAWTRLNLDSHLGEVLAGLQAWKTVRDPVYMPYAQGWLNQESWKDTPVGGKQEQGNANANLPKSFDAVRRENTDAAARRVIEKLSGGGVAAGPALPARIRRV